MDFEKKIVTVMHEEIETCQQAIRNYVLTQANEKKFRATFLSRKGRIRSLFQQLHTCPKEERHDVGKLLNELKALAQAKHTDFLTRKEMPSVATDAQDLTMPPISAKIGSLHILTLIEAKVVDILQKIGFKPVEGPEIEDDWHNFSALNFPPHHPARDMQDTFFIKQKKEVEPMALRTQTSSVQIRIMEQQQPPIRILSLGRVFRKETISTRSHCMFHQVEGLYVNRRVTFANLTFVLDYFVHSLFGKDIAMRLRPSYFPFTEPSAEVDIGCLLCESKGCRMCKNTGWVEIGGAGMVDPQVLINCNLSPDTYTGFAFGIGVERMAMLLAHVPDVRLFTENDLRFLKQFTGWSY